MKNLNKQHEDLMRLLDSVPGVTEHMQSFEVQMAGKIFKRRLELGFTQSQVVEMVHEKGERITQATVSKVESGDTSISGETYDKILKVLGGVKHIDIQFGDLPENSKKMLKHA